MLRALDPSHLREQAAGSPARLLELQQRWLAEARAIATLLLDLEAELETLVRDLAAECEELTTESAHVQLALAGIRLELDRLPPSPFHHRTPA